MESVALGGCWRRARGSPELFACKCGSVEIESQLLSLKLKGKSRGSLPNGKRVTASSNISELAVIVPWVCCPGILVVT